MKIKIEEILELKKRFREINSQDLTNLKFSLNDKEVVIDPKFIEEFRFTGLNNIDFITSEFYKYGFDEDEKTST